MTPAAIESAFRAACELDVVALKPGNVRDGAPFDDMVADDFRRSAAACAPVLARAGAPGRSIGESILDAVTASRRVVQCNTNLGIVLLAAPLCCAAARYGDLRRGVAAVLDALTQADARDAFAAIRLANPGGLGRRPRHDVASAPTVTLREAMCEAAADDLVARQYCASYQDVFARGLPAWHRAVASLGDERWATTFVYMQFASDFPDSHVARRRGGDAAREVREQARTLSVHDQEDPTRLPERVDALLAWDAQLRRAGRNPGTSADLTVATILAAKLTPTV